MSKKTRISNNDRSDSLNKNNPKKKASEDNRSVQIQKNKEADKAQKKKG